MATRSRKKSSRKPAVKPATRARKAGKTAKPKRRKASAVPRGYHTATAYLVVRGAARALEFYGRAFGAREKVRMASPDGSVMHAEMQVGDSMIMLADENPQMGSKSPQALGGSATHVMLYVKDVDALVARAVAAGASVVMAPADMFWGDRYGKLRDPFGHEWSVGTHLEDVRPAEMKRRMADFARQTAQG